MAYSTASKLLGVSVISNFLTKYRNYNNGSSITHKELMQAILPSGYAEDTFTGILGNAFEYGLERDYELLDERMDALARDTSGGYPSRDSFIERMKNEKSKFEIIYKALGESAVVIGEGVQKFNENSLFLLSTLNTLFPFLILGGIAYFIYRNKDRLALSK